VIDATGTANYNDYSYPVRKSRPEQDVVSAQFTARDSACSGNIRQIADGLRSERKTGGHQVYAKWVRRSELIIVQLIRAYPIRIQSK
jgi:hypothetical protein